MDWDRIAAARRQARSILAIAFVVTGLAVFLLVAAPPFSEPSFGCAPPVLTISGIVTNCEGAPTGIPLEMIPWAVGALGLLVGFAWIWKLYHAPTRFEGAQWRFHDQMTKATF